MFLTPRWVRKAVGTLDDRKAHDILVRARAAAIFYLIIGIVAGFLLCVGIDKAQANAHYGFAIDEITQLAHSGGLAKDGCHKDKSADERHWHFENSRDRAGPCIDGVKVSGEVERLRKEVERLEGVVLQFESKKHECFRLYEAWRASYWSDDRREIIRSMVFKGCWIGVQQ